MSVRVYLAAGRDGVTALVSGTPLEAPAFAVTDALRSADPRAEEEELEYEAALAAEALLRERGQHVVVIAADVPAAQPIPEGGHPSSVSVDPVPATAVVSLHVAEHGAGPDEELLWYDVTEAAEVARYLG